MKNTKTVTSDFDTMITEIKEEIASASDETKGEFEELLREMEEDKAEMLEGTVVGSPQYLKDDLTMHIASISIGALMSIAGGILLVKTRKVIGTTRTKITGWILGGLGLGIVGLHIAQMFM